MSNFDFDKVTAELSAHNRQQTSRERRERSKEKSDSLRKPVIILGVLECNQTIRYKPPTSVAGGHFVTAIRELSAKYRMVANNLAGLGPGDISYAHSEQIWQFSPNPSRDRISTFIKELESLFEAKLKAHFK